MFGNIRSSKVECHLKQIVTSGDNQNLKIILLAFLRIPQENSSPVVPLTHRVFLTSHGSYPTPFIKPS
ncbi:MAG: hypothetical protein JWR25_2050 [Noviherbaspirillum sp.]|nr:hypothetical protein [Noviherbaspirillum sp.]